MIVVGVLVVLAGLLVVEHRRRRLLEAKLARSRQLLERADRLSSLGTMTAGLAHEIRNPLVSIQTFTQPLPERFDDHEFRTKFLELTLSEVERITVLINELLDVARPRHASFEPSDLAATLESIVLLLEAQAKDRGIEFKSGLPESAQPVLADQDQIKQVVMNLVLNAMDAAGRNGRVTLGLRETAGAVLIEVGDSGPGIAPELREAIFEPFYTTREEGTGLGLSIVAEIVARHDGRVEIEERLPSGTLFRVCLPVLVEDNAGAEDVQVMIASG